MCKVTIPAMLLLALINSTGVCNAESQLDDRLTQKITYRAKAKPIKVILADVSRMTGVTLRAGYNNTDWQVRDRRMNAFVRDVTLATLMNSIARVMKFKWSKNDQVDPVVYRLCADRRLIGEMSAEQQRRQEELNNEIRARRQELCNILSTMVGMSDAEAQALGDKSPYLYYQWKIGMPKLVEAIFRDAPLVKEAFINAERNVNPPCSVLSAETKRLLLETMKSNWQLQTSDKPFPKSVTEDLEGCRMAFEIVPRVTNAWWDRGQLIDFGGMGVNVPKGAPPHNWIRAFKFRYPFDTPEKEADEEIAYYLMFDPQAEHGDEPDLHKKFKLKFDDPAQIEEVSNSKATEFDNIMEAIAETTGYSVVTDTFARTPAMRVSDELELKQLLDGTARYSFCNWNKRGSLIEFTHRDWFRRRAAQVPDEWLEGWRKALTSKGYLTIDEFAEMLALDFEQITENIVPDPVLGCCCSDVSPEVWNTIANRPLLKFYLTLRAAQRYLLFSEDGLNLGALKSKQYQLASEMLDDKHTFSWGAEGFAARSPGDIVLKGRVTRKVLTGQILYWFDAESLDGSDHYGWKVKLPKYNIGNTPGTAPAASAQQPSAPAGSGQNPADSGNSGQKPLDPKSGAPNE